MASITITIPDAQVPRVLDAFAATFGYVSDGTQTKGQFAKAQLARWARDITLNYERQEAARNIVDTALDVT